MYAGTEESAHKLSAISVLCAGLLICVQKRFYVQSRGGGGEHLSWAAIGGEARGERRSGRRSVPPSRAPGVVYSVPIELLSSGISGWRSGECRCPRPLVPFSPRCPPQHRKRVGGRGQLPGFERPAGAHVGGSPHSGVSSGTFFTLRTHREMSG